MSYFDLFNPGFGNRQIQYFLNIDRRQGVFI
jgi:hypothetical protein